jgi:lipopolysaccharide/colanic/teichoic acid biosynthesis glycosyltransferase
MKRLFDIIVSLIALLVLMPFLFIIGLLIAMESKGGAFYQQVRVGKDQVPFKLLKFRSMRPGSDKKGLITVGNNDNRITGMGRFVRKYKVDELPQLINVIKGDMSLVGPRPEVPKYVALYNPVQLKVLSVRPGLTDYASLEYFDENEVLAKTDDPHKTYVEEIMPRKLALNLKYIEEQSFLTDLKIIGKTVRRIFS